MAELHLGLWLLLSPFVLRHGPDATLLWTVDLTAGVLVVTVSLLSFSRRLPRFHLVHLLTATALGATGWIAGGPDPLAAHRNWVVVAFLILMIAIVPSRAERPPRAWRRFYEDRAEADDT